MDTDTVENSNQPRTIAFSTFLEQQPPNCWWTVPDAIAPYGINQVIATPDLQLYCDSPTCQGVRFFSYSGQQLFFSRSATVFLGYTCRNCNQQHKTYALWIFEIQDPPNLPQIAVFKYGEHPTFGPSVPSRVISMIGPDRELFIRGMRAEYQGLGIGAFSYYRRVVENQKGRVLSQIAKVAKRLNLAQSMINDLEAAAKETQFSKAVEMVKEAIPPTLMIKGHNPLTLLHTALSEGIHDRTDAECLDAARDIRIVLTEIAERVSLALKDDTELNDALSRLLNRKLNELPPDST